MARIVRWRKIGILLAATTAGVLPWDTPLTTLQNDLQGPVAHAVTTSAIIGTGIMWSVSEHGTGVRKMSPWPSAVPTVKEMRG